jgi:hypothetical protein
VSNRVSTRRIESPEASDDHRSDRLDRRCDSMTSASVSESRSITARIPAILRTAPARPHRCPPADAPLGGATAATETATGTIHSTRHRMTPPLTRTLQPDTVPERTVGTGVESARHGGTPRANR